MKRIRSKIILGLILISGFSSFLSNLLSTPLVPELFGDASSWGIDLIKSAFENSLSLVIFTVFIILGVREITAPVLRLADAANRIAKGDFDVTIPKTRRKDEVGQLENSFGVMVEELKSTEYLQRDFISNVSHEYKTPLAVIGGYARLLGEDTLTDEERAQYSALIVEETQRLSEMTSNILLLSKLENQYIQPSFASFSLDEQLRQAALLYFPNYQDKQVSLEIDAPPLGAYGSEELLMHVWTNLLENALKFTEPGGAVSICAQALEGGLQVTVRDNGIGIDEASQPRIFDQFYQGDTSRKGAGNGLGLPLARRIVQMHQGDIQVSSTPGHGATFTVTLPVAA